MSINVEKQFFPALTGLRAIAAWMVFMFHFAPYNNPKLPEFIKLLFKEFHIGVDIFFVLSGFLITYRYYSNKPIDLKKYLVNRVARIYPMYFLLVTGTFATYYFTRNTWDSEKTTELILGLTLSKALFAKYISSGVMQGWTLTLEELFYFTAPLYFVLIRKKWWWLIVLPMALFAFGSSLKALSVFFDNSWGFMQDNISAFAGEFFAGIGLAFLLKRNASLFNAKYLTCTGLFMIFVYIIAMQYLSKIFSFQSDAVTFIFRIILSVFGIAPLLAGLILEKTAVQKLLSTKAMLVLGKSSYAFYLIHMGWIANLVYNYISENKAVIFIVLNLLSIALFYLFEEPANKFIRKKFTGSVQIPASYKTDCNAL